MRSGFAASRRFPPGDSQIFSSQQEHGRSSEPSDGALLSETPSTIRQFDRSTGVECLGRGVLLGGTKTVMIKS
jgi:hypothetical protein